MWVQKLEKRQSYEYNNFPKDVNTNINNIGNYTNSVTKTVFIKRLTTNMLIHKGNALIDK